ncbi:hypothetical protein SAMN05216548_1262 [Faunimonas pinastri]|uniref:Uncharacterized protein n=1 Tax=Faunimonas pinastri TaxID=1855383 RepID=A0A1H9Q7Z7_9HYPH|nr:hypothetical protein [Faunimonas pinastri]SER56611.1 hypothetical protein SAMN05216548_1262 [Faunimonas pinastri]
MAETSGAAALDDITVSNNADWPPESYTVAGSDGTVMSLSGCTVAMQIRESADSTSVLLDLVSPATGITISDDETAFTIGPNAALMSAVGAGDYVRDIIITRGTETLYGGRGSVTVLQGITRS